MATRTIEIHDRCTTPTCGKVLHSIHEGESGHCSSCWVRQMDPNKRKAMNRLIASAFNGSTDAEKDDAVADAFDKERHP